MGILVTQAEMISGFVESALYGTPPPPTHFLTVYACYNGRDYLYRILCIPLWCNCMGSRLQTLHGQSKSSHARGCMRSFLPQYHGVFTLTLALSGCRVIDVFQRWAVDIKTVYDGFLGSQDAALFFADTSQQTWKNAVYACQTILGDGVLVGHSCISPLYIPLT